jgi:hypothetical protein
MSGLSRFLAPQPSSHGCPSTGQRNRTQKRGIQVRARVSGSGGLRWGSFAILSEKTGASSVAPTEEQISGLSPAGLSDRLLHVKGLWCRPTAQQTQGGRRLHPTGPDGRCGEVRWCWEILEVSLASRAGIDGSTPQRPMCGAFSHQPPVEFFCRLPVAAGGSGQ